MYKPWTLNQRQSQTPFSSAFWLVLTWPVLTWQVLTWRVLTWPVLTWPVLTWPTLTWLTLTWPVLSWTEGGKYFGSKAILTLLRHFPVPFRRPLYTLRTPTFQAHFRHPLHTPKTHTKLHEVGFSTRAGGCLLVPLAESCHFVVQLVRFQAELKFPIWTECGNSLIPLVLTFNAELLVSNATLMQHYLL